MEEDEEDASEELEIEEDEEEGLEALDEDLFSAGEDEKFETKSPKKSPKPSAPVLASSSAPNPLKPVEKLDEKAIEETAEIEDEFDVEEIDDLVSFQFRKFPSHSPSLRVSKRQIGSDEETEEKPSPKKEESKAVPQTSVPSKPEVKPIKEEEDEGEVDLEFDIGEEDDEEAEKPKKEEPKGSEGSTKAVDETAEFSDDFEADDPEPPVKVKEDKGQSFEEDFEDESDEEKPKEVTPVSGSGELIDGSTNHEAEEEEEVGEEIEEEVIEDEAKPAKEQERKIESKEPPFEADFEEDEGEEKKKPQPAQDRAKLPETPTVAKKPETIQLEEPGMGEITEDLEEIAEKFDEEDLKVEAIPSKPQASSPIIRAPTKPKDDDIFEEIEEKFGDEIDEEEVVEEEVVKESSPKPIPAPSSNPKSSPLPQISHSAKPPGRDPEKPQVAASVHEEKKTSEPEKPITEEKKRVTPPSLKVTPPIVTPMPKPALETVAPIAGPPEPIPEQEELPDDGTLDGVIQAELDTALMATGKSVEMGDEVVDQVDLGEELDDEEEPDRREPERPTPMKSTKARLKDAQTQTPPLSSFVPLMGLTEPAATCTSPLPTVDVGVGPEVIFERSAEKPYVFHDWSRPDRRQTRRPADFRFRVNTGSAFVQPPSTSSLKQFLTEPLVAMAHSSSSPLRSSLLGSSSKWPPMRPSIFPVVSSSRSIWRKTDITPPRHFRSNIMAPVTTAIFLQSRIQFLSPSTKSFT